MQPGDGNVNEEDYATNFQRKKRKKVSKVHQDFEDVILTGGVKKSKCIHCGKLLCTNSSSTTSHLKNHLARCLQSQVHQKNQQTLQLQPKTSTFEMKPLCDGKYDHMKQREAIAHWILTTEQPLNVVESPFFTFMFKINQPQYEKISRASARSDVISVYELERKKIQLALTSIKNISLTTDVWKSKVQKISYMCVTGHYVDANWDLQKLLLNFIPLPPPHTGLDIIDKLMKCTKEWGIEQKVYTISVHNASNNDVAINVAIDTFSRNDLLPLGGMLFHVRCTAHILNLIVQDGIKEIEGIVLKVRKSVRLISQSEARLIKFSQIVHQLGLPSKRLIIDCATRWNSTYEMLLLALKVKHAFPIFKQMEPLIGS